MDKKSILEAARKNGDRGNEFELRENIGASVVSAISMLAVGMLLFLIEYFMMGVPNVSLIILGVTAIAADTLYKGIVFKKYWRIVLGSSLALVAVIMIIARVVMA